MGYQNPLGCCCNSCTTALFYNAVTTNLLKVAFHPDGSAGEWGYTTDWGTANPVFQHNSGFEATPAGSLSYQILENSRSGAMDFRFSFRVYPVYKASTHSFVLGKVGGFIANAFVVWVDFTTQAVYWAPSDAVGTIPASGTLVKNLGFNPAEMLVEVYIFRNEKGTWNLQFHDSATDTTGLNLNWLLEWDKSLPGLEPGSIVFGGSTDVGGGGIGSLLLACGSGQICSQCWDGLPQQWSIDCGMTASGVILSLPTVLDNWGGCLALNDSSPSVLDASVRLVQVGSGSFLPLASPVGSTTLLQWDLSLSGFYGFSVDSQERISLTVRVFWEGLFGIRGWVVVAAYICNWEDFCCYGRNNTFVKTRLFPDYTFFGGTEGQIGYYTEQYGTWPSSVIVKSIGPPSDMPCTQTCVYVSVRDPITRILSWQLQNSAINQHVECPGEAACPQPPMDPSRESQWVYIPCSA